MAVISTKFAVNDVCYTFNSTTGSIHRHLVHEVSTHQRHSDTEIKYSLINTTPVVPGRVNTEPEYEQNLYTEVEVKDLANTWLINKSISVFSNAGL